MNPEERRDDRGEAVVESPNSQKSSEDSHVEFSASSPGRHRVSGEEGSGRVFQRVGADERDEADGLKEVREESVLRRNNSLVTQARSRPGDLARTSQAARTPKQSSFRPPVLKRRAAEKGESDKSAAADSRFRTRDDIGAARSSSNYARTELEGARNKPRLREGRGLLFNQASRILTRQTRTLNGKIISMKHSQNLTNSIDRLLEQAQRLLSEGGPIDWVAMICEQVRKASMLALTDNAERVRKMLSGFRGLIEELKKRGRIRDVIDIYKEVMYLAEKAGSEAMLEQIELNLLTAESYAEMRCEGSDFLACYMQVASYANEACTLCRKYGVQAQVARASSLLDLAENRYLSASLLQNDIAITMMQTLSTDVRMFPALFQHVRRILYRLAYHREFDLVKKWFDSGLNDTWVLSIKRFGHCLYVNHLLDVATYANSVQLAREGAAPAPEPRELLEPSYWSQISDALDGARRDLDRNLRENKLDYEWVKKTIAEFNSQLVGLIKSVLDTITYLLGKPPCGFCVFALGSISRGEAAPFSDMEYGILIEQESARDSPYWRNHCSLVDFFFICFGERTGLHIDDQGTPRVPSLRGTPAQLVETFLAPMDVNGIGLAFSMVRPAYITGHPAGSRKLYDEYLKNVDEVLGRKQADGTFFYQKISTFFLRDHLALISKRASSLFEDDADVELKAEVIQPISYIVFDLALFNGAVLGTGAEATICWVDLIQHSGLKSGDATVSLSPEFAADIKRLYVCALRIRMEIQIRHHGQLEGGVVSKTSREPEDGEGQEAYALDRESWDVIKAIKATVLRPMYLKLLDLMEGAGGCVFRLKDVRRYVKPCVNMDPNLEEMSRLLEKSAMGCRVSYERAMIVIQSLAETLVLRGADVKKHRSYYKRLPLDLKDCYRRSISRVADSYADRARAAMNVLSALSMGDFRSLSQTTLAWKNALSSLDMERISALLDSRNYENKSWTALPVLQLLVKIDDDNSYSEDGKNCNVSLGVEHANCVGDECAITLFHRLSAHQSVPLLDLRVLEKECDKGRKMKVPIMFCQDWTHYKTLLEAVKQDLAELDKLDKKRFSEMVLINSVLLCTGEQSLYALRPHCDSQTYSLVKQNVFGTQLLPEPISKKDGARDYLWLNSRDLLFCLSNMFDPVSEKTANWFKNLDPIEAIDTWVSSVRSLFAEWQNVLSLNAVERPGQNPSIARECEENPSRQAKESVFSISQECVYAMYRRIVSIQHALASGAIKTHLDILRTVNPVVAGLYARTFGLLREKAPAKSEMIKKIAEKHDIKLKVAQDYQDASLSEDQRAAWKKGTTERWHSIKYGNPFSTALIYEMDAEDSSLYRCAKKIEKHSSEDPQTLNELLDLEYIEAVEGLEFVREQTKLSLLKLSLLTENQRKSLKSSPYLEKSLADIDFSNQETDQTLLDWIVDSVGFVKQLNLKNCACLTHRHLSHLVNVQNFKTLKVVDLRNASSLEQPAVNLIAKLKNVEYLNMSGSNISGIYVEKLFKCDAISLGQLTWLILKNCKNLSSVLLNAPNLRHLNIEGCESLVECQVKSQKELVLVVTGVST